MSVEQVIHTQATVWTCVFIGLCMLVLLVATMDDD